MSFRLLIYPNIALFLTTIIVSSFFNPALASKPNDQQRLQVLLDHVPVPKAFHTTKLFYLNDEDQPSQQFENWVSSNWSISLQSMNQPGLDYIPYDYIHGTKTETWRYFFPQHSAERSDLFARLSRIGGGDLRESVVYILRILRKGEAKVSNISVDSESDLTLVTLSQPQLFIEAILTFDNKNGWLTRVQTFGNTGDLVSDTHFDDWRPLNDNQSIPYRISTQMPGSEPIDMLSTVIEAEIIDDEQLPERLPLSPNFTIIDQIEGVTKTADGKVIGPIERGKPTPNANTVRTGPPGTTGLKPRLVMLVGVGLILLAGIILGLRRWKGA